MSFTEVDTGTTFWKFALKVLVLMDVGCLTSTNNFVLDDNTLCEIIVNIKHKGMSSM